MKVMVGRGVIRNCLGYHIEVPRGHLSPSKRPTIGQSWREVLAKNSPSLRRVSNTMTGKTQ